MDRVRKAFMKVLISSDFKAMTVKAITQLFWDNVSGMDKLVDYIKCNSNITDSDVLRASININIEG